MAAAFAAKGHEVIGVDTDPATVEALEDGRAPIFEPHLEELLRQHRESFRATSSYELAIQATDVSFVVVATPSDEMGGFSLRYVLSVCDSIGQELRKKDGYHLVVITSTVLPGAMDREIRPALERASGKRAGQDFGLCYSPEFIALGSVIRDLMNPDFALIGEVDSRSGDVLESLYTSIHENDAHIARMNLVNAEIAKLSVNTFVTMKISFANTIAGICERLPGADVDTVTAAIGHDERIGHRYLRGALGYGGPCFPRDNVALTYLASLLGAPSDLASATDAVNRGQVPHLLELVKSKLSKGGRVAVLGLSYKPDTDVVEASQGIMLLEALLQSGIDVVAYDPMATENAARVLPQASYAGSTEEAVQRADVVVVATPWTEFESLAGDPVLLEGEGDKVVIDCWRIFDRDSLPESIQYVSLGVGI